MNIVFISGFLSEHSFGGPAIRAKNSLEILEKLGSVSVFDLDSTSSFIWTGGSGRPLDRKIENRARVISLIRIALHHRISRTLQILEIFTQLVSLSSYFKLKRLIIETEPDAVWFSFASKFPKLFLVLRKKFPSVVFVADTDAVISTHLRRASESLSGIRRFIYLYLSKQTMKYESKILISASVTTAVSEIDLQEYRNSAPSAALAVFPNFVLANELVETDLKKFPTPKVLITGTFGGTESAMTHGTLWFLNEVLPILNRLVSDLSIDIVGRNANQIRQYMDLPKDVSVISNVPSLTPYLSEAWCSACPLFFESGD